MNPHPFATSTTAPLTLLAAKFWPQRHGGVETRLWQMARAMAQLNQPVRVLTENRDQLPPEQTILPCLSVARLPAMDHGRLWRWPDLPRLKWWIDALNSQRPAGLIWATQPVMALAAILTGRGGQLIYNPACCVAAMRELGLRDPRMTTMQLPRITRWMEHAACRLAGRVIVSSENLARQFREHESVQGRLIVLPSATEIPPHLPDPDDIRQQLGIPAQAFVVGFMGRLDPCKDLDFLFHALAQSRHPAVKLLVAGDGPDRPRLARLAEQLNLSSRIIWMGSTSQPVNAYAAMDALALTSAYEAFGLVIPEAMACGVPALGRRSSPQGIRNACEELIAHGRTGLLVDAHQPADLGRRIDELAGQPLLCRRLGLNARQAVASHTWSHYAQRCLDLLGLRPPAMPLRQAA